MSDFDSPWKEALDLYFEAFMLLAFPLLWAEIDWSRGYEILDKELQRVMPKDAEGRLYVDKLMKVWTLSGEERWLLIHVEIQTQATSDFPERMFAYFVRVRERYQHEVVSVAVLADDRPDWRPNRYEYEARGMVRLSFEYPIFKLLDYREEAEHERNPFAMVIRAHLATLRTRQQPEGRRREKIALVKELYAQGLDAMGVRQLFRLIDWLMELPPVMDGEFWSEIKKLEKEKPMPFITTAQRVERAEGRVEGEAVGLRKALKLILIRHYSMQDPKTLREFDAVEDVELLQRMLEAATDRVPIEMIREMRN